MKNTNTLWKFDLEHFSYIFKGLGDFFSYIISLTVTVILTAAMFGIPVIVIVIFLKIVSSII